MRSLRRISKFYYKFACIMHFVSIVLSNILYTRTCDISLISATPLSNTLQVSPTRVNASMWFMHYIHVSDAMCATM